MVILLNNRQRKIQRYIIITREKLRCYCNMEDYAWKQETQKQPGKEGTAKG